MTSFFDVFGHPKNHQKMDPSKIVIFSILGSLRGSPGPIFGDVGVPKGSRGRQFYSFVLIRFLAWILDYVLSKNTKKQKNENVSFDTRFTVFCEGRHVQDNERRYRKKSTKKTSNFYSKIDGKSMKKLVAAAFPAKIDKKTAT